MKIKIKRINKDLHFPQFIKKGEWIDLRSSIDKEYSAPIANTLHKGKTARTVEFETFMIPLGVAMKIPEGYEAILAPRSSMFKKYGIMQTNSIGVIDSSYCSDKDEWKLPVIALNTSHVNKGDRICQFRIQLSQKATIWQKIKWLFSSKIELIEVESLGGIERGGFGEGTINFD